MYGLGRHRRHLDGWQRRTDVEGFRPEDEAAKGELNFVQISDSHMGFNKPANPDVTGTLQATIEKINALPQQPDFIIHTGDLSHTSKRANSTRSIRC